MYTDEVAVFLFSHSCSKRQSTACRYGLTGLRKRISDVDSQDIARFYLLAPQAARAGSSIAARARRTFRQKSWPRLSGGAVSSDPGIAADSGQALEDEFLTDFVDHHSRA